MTISTTLDKRLSKLEPPPQPRPMTERALRRAVLAELAAAAEHYGVDANDLDALAGFADRHGAFAHRGAQVALILLEVQDRLDELG